MAVNENKQVTEDQHIVPKFYFKRFANKKNFLQVLDLKSKKLVRPRPYAGVCFEHFFYAQKTGVKDDLSQSAEDILRELENNVARHLPQIYNKILNYEHIKPDEKYAMACFSSMLWLRSKYMRKQLNRMNEDITKQMMERQASHKNFSQYVKQLFENSGKTLVDDDVNKIRQTFLERRYSLDFDNGQHLRFLFGELERFANMFYGKHWRIYFAKGTKRFITSDTPVIEWFPERRGSYGTSFLERKHYLVLSPEVLIEMVYPKSGKGIKRKYIYDEEVMRLNIMRAELSIDYCFAERSDELQELADYRAEKVDKPLREIIKFINEKLLTEKLLG